MGEGRKEGDRFRCYILCPGRFCPASRLDKRWWAAAVCSHLSSQTHKSRISPPPRYFPCVSLVASLLFLDYISHHLPASISLWFLKHTRCFAFTLQPTATAAAHFSKVNIT